MTVYQLPAGNAVPFPACPLAIALGNFDGVHLGHRRLLGEAVRAAAQLPNAMPAVWTFKTLAKQEDGIPALTSMEEKLQLFAAAGIRYAIFEDFPAVRTLSADTFAREYLPRLGAAAVVCGFNFHFGYGGVGDASLLRRALREQDVPLTVVEPVLHGGAPISSTRIRQALQDGDCAEAAALLGRPFSLSLPVLHGKALGRTLGMPTINQTPPTHTLVPQRGIYASAAKIDGIRYPSVTNIGVRPTVERTEAVNCETHILDYSGDLYGRTVQIEFFIRLREEFCFPSLDSLRAQIASDIDAARIYFAAHPLR